MGNTCSNCTTCTDTFQEHQLQIKSYLCGAQDVTNETTPYNQSITLDNQDLLIMQMPQGEGLNTSKYQSGMYEDHEVNANSLKRGSSIQEDALTTRNFPLKQRIHSIVKVEEVLPEQVQMVTTLVLQDGSTYNGQIKKNNSLKDTSLLVKHGHGEQIWKDGARYLGQWRTNKANGKGIFYHINGDVYEGNFSEDKANGYGVYFHKNGSKYEGEWEDDQKNGYGREEWDDGAFYEGNFAKGKKHNAGLYRWADGSSYNGIWVVNTIEGFGVYNWPDGRKFTGTWKNNKLHGQGTYTWADGRKYEGQYFEDKKQGLGIYLWPDGRCYNGQWFNGKQHGEGEFTNSKGKSRRGEWNDGNRVKWFERDSIQAASTSISIKEQSSPSKKSLNDKIRKNVID